MYSLKVISAPPDGIAPDSIKEKWIGLSLPYFRSDFAGPEAPIFDERTNCRVYPTPMLTAVEVLRLHQPEAAEWWFANGRTIFPGNNFLFSESVVQIVPELPSLFYKTAEGKDGLLGKDFFDKAQLEPKLNSACKLIRNLLGLAQWKQLQGIPFSRALVFFLVDLLSHGLDNLLMSSSIPESYYPYAESAKHFAQHLYDFTWLNGIEIEEELVNRPLGVFDADSYEMVQQYLVIDKAKYN